jgi:hypothetical protein
MAQYGAVYWTASQEAGLVRRSARYGRGPGSRGRRSAFTRGLQDGRTGYAHEKFDYFGVSSISSISMSRFISIWRFSTSVKSSGKPIPFLLSLAGKVFPNASLDQSAQKDFCAQGNVVQIANSVAEIDLGGHLVVVDGPIIHTLPL